MNPEDMTTKELLEELETVVKPHMGGYERFEACLLEVTTRLREVSQPVRRA